MSKHIINPKFAFKKHNKMVLNKRGGRNEEEEEEQQDAAEEQQAQQIEFTLPFNLIQLNGEINGKTARMVTDLLLAYDTKNKIQGWMQPIHLMINSGGGQVVDAWQICDIMDCIDTPVFTIGCGQIASAALTIFINGEKGFRVLSEHTSVMSHQYSWGVAGKMDDLVSAHREFNNIYTRMENHFHRKTGLKRKIIKEKLLGGLDNWMTAEEAMKMKLADTVLDFKKTSPFIIVEPPPEITNKQKNRKGNDGKPDSNKK